jgi:hypothetical protein
MSIDTFTVQEVAETTQVYLVNKRNSESLPRGHCSETESSRSSQQGRKVWAEKMRCMPRPQTLTET